MQDKASYAASKAGIIGFTKSVAKELGSRNIRCNAIAPGFVETDMTCYLKEGERRINIKPVFRWDVLPSAEDIANVALFLACDMGNLYYRTNDQCLRGIEYLAPRFS